MSSDDMVGVGCCGLAIVVVDDASPSLERDGVVDREERAVTCCCCCCSRILGGGGTGTPSSPSEN